MNILQFARLKVKEKAERENLERDERIILLDVTALPEIKQAYFH